MRIIEPGNNGVTLGINDAGSRATMLRHLRSLADTYELSVLHRERGRLWTLSVHCNDFGIRDY